MGRERTGLSPRTLPSAGLRLRRLHHCSAGIQPECPCLQDGERPASRVKLPLLLIQYGGCGIVSMYLPASATVDEEPLGPGRSTPSSEPTRCLCLHQVNGDGGSWRKAIPCCTSHNCSALALHSPCHPWHSPRASQPSHPTDGSRARWHRRAGYRASGCVSAPKELPCQETSHPIRSQQYGV